MPRRLVVILLVAGLALAGAAAAEIDLPYLLNLHGEICSVRYSPGALDRAAHVQMRLESLAKVFTRWGSRPYTFQGYVLGPEDWAAAGLARGYGVTDRSGGRTVAVPAWGDEQSVALWKRLLGGALPWGEGLPVRGTAEEAASLSLADILLQVDLARVFVEGEQLGGAEPWIAELAAHATALQAFAYHEAPRLEEIAEVWSRLGARGRPSLAACAAPKLELAADLACQARFYDGARLLLAKDGLKTVRRLEKLARKQRLDEAALVREYPALAEWLRQGVAGE